MKKITILLCLFAVLAMASSAMAVASSDDMAASEQSAAAAAANNSPEDTAKNAISNFRSESNQALKIARLKEAGQAYIISRIDSLTSVLNRVSNLKVDDQVKSDLTAKIDAQISGLNALKAEIAGGTDLAALKLDVKSVFDGHYIYAVFIPSIHVAVAAERLNAVSQKFVVLDPKIEAYLNNLKSGGTDVLAGETAFSDFRDQISKIQSSIKAANEKISLLNLSDFTGSKALIKEARANLLAARQAMAKASSDLTIISSLSNN